MKKKKKCVFSEDSWFLKGLAFFMHFKSAISQHCHCHFAITHFLFCKLASTRLRTGPALPWAAWEPAGSCATPCTPNSLALWGHCRRQGRNASRSLPCVLRECSTRQRLGGEGQEKLVIAPVTARAEGCWAGPWVVKAHGHCKAECSGKPTREVGQKPNGLGPKFWFYHLLLRDLGQVT